MNFYTLIIIIVSKLVRIEIYIPKPKQCTYDIISINFNDSHITIVNVRVVL